jgi:hypothetical protein
LTACGFFVSVFLVFSLFFAYFASIIEKGNQTDENPVYCHDDMALRIASFGTTAGLV